MTFLTGPALKVLSVGDGKIPTKKRESKGISQRKYEALTQTFTFLIGILPSPTLKKSPCKIARGAVPMMPKYFQSRVTGEATKPGWTF